MRDDLWFGVDVRLVDGAAVMDVVGEVDAYTADSLRDPLYELIDKGHTRLVLDLEALAFIDSTGLGILVGAAKRARPHGGLVTLALVPDNTRRMLAITGLTKVFPVFATCDEAVAFLRQRDAPATVPAGGALPQGDDVP